MKESLKRFLIGSLAVLVLAGSQTTQVFARNKTVQWMAQKLKEMSLIVQDASVLDWDDEDGALIILGHSDPDRVVYFEPDRPHEEGQEVVVIDPTIKSDDSRIQKVMFGGGIPGAHGYITVTVIGTERVMKVCLDTPDIYILRHDSGTGVFERTEKEGPETKKWYCLYAKDKVRACEAPQTGEINEYKELSGGKYDITVPFIEENKSPMFGGTAILYDWNKNEITRSKYEAHAQSVHFTGTDTRIIPGFTYYVNTIPDKGMDYDAEGFVYESDGTAGELQRFALGCKGSDPVDLGNPVKGFEINYGYKDDNSGYEPALKWDGKIEEDGSLLVKPLNTLSDWILKTRDTGDASASITVDSYDPGAVVAIDNSASSAVSHITKKSDNVRMSCTEGTLLARSANRQYLATKYNADLKQVLTATVDKRTSNSLKFKFAAVGEGVNKLEVPAVATLTDSNGRKIRKQLAVNTSETEFTGLDAGQRYLLSLSIDDSEEYMPEGCNGIISNRSDTRILYAVELEKDVEAETERDGVTGVTEDVLPNGNIHITNSSPYDIKYVISESDKWKEGDPFVSTGSVGHGKQHFDKNIVKQNVSKTYYIYYKYDDAESHVESPYTTGKELIVEPVRTLKANWKTDISLLDETVGNDKYIRSALKDSANVVIAETNTEYKDAEADVYVIDESEYTTDEALMVPENKVGVSTEFVPGTYVAIVGLSLSDDMAAEQGFKVIHKSEIKTFTVYAGKVENVIVTVKPNGNINIENPNNYKIDYKIVSSPAWTEGDPEDSNGSVGRKTYTVDTNIVKTKTGKTYYVFYKYNDTEKKAVSKEWTKHPDPIYVGDLKTIRANWKTDVSGFDVTYSDDEASLRINLMSAGEAIIAETGAKYDKTEAHVYAIDKKNYTTDEALMTEANKITKTTNLNAGTYVAIVGIDISDEEAATEGYRVVHKSETKEFTVKRASLTLVIKPETRTVWNKTQKVKKSEWNVFVEEDEALAADPSSFRLVANNPPESVEINDDGVSFEKEAEYRLATYPVNEAGGYVIKNGETVIDNSNYNIIEPAGAIMYVSNIEDESNLEARKNGYTNKLYYDDLKHFASNEQLKTYLDVYVDGTRKLDNADYKLVVDDSETGNISDLDAKFKKVGASFTVSVHPNVDDLPVVGDKNKLTLTVSKQPIVIKATEPELLHHFVGDNPVRFYKGAIAVIKLDIDGKEGDEITDTYGAAIANWATYDAVSVDLGYIDTDRPGTYNIELKDIVLKPTIAENYSLQSAGGAYTIDTAVKVSVYDLATGKKLAPDVIAAKGDSDIIVPTTNKGEATDYTQWYIRDWNSEGEKFSWPVTLGFAMESYNTTGLKIKRVGASAVAFQGNLEVYGSFPSDRKSDDVGDFYALDIDPVVYNGNKFVAEGDSKFIDASGAVKKGYTAQLDVAVFDGGTELIYGIDYTLSYKNNINAANANAGKMAPTVTIKGIGAYKGKSIEKKFTILPADLSRLAQLKLGSEYMKYNGKALSTIVKGDVVYSVGSKAGKKLAKKSYTFRIYDDSGKEVSNTEMPKDSKYGVYSVVAIATGYDKNFTGETAEVKMNVLPADANGKFKVNGIKKTVNYTAGGVGYADFIDAAKFRIAAGKLLITDINDPRVKIDIVSRQSEDAFAISKLTNTGDYYLRIKPSQFNTFEVEKIFEPVYVKITYKGTAVKNLVQLKTKKYTWNGSNHNIDLKVSNKVTNPADILLYKQPLKKDDSGNKIEQYIGTLADFADNGIPGGVLDNSASGTYAIKIYGTGSCYGESGVSYTVSAPKYNKKSVTAYINKSKKQEDIELDFNRAGYSDDLVKVYWKDPSNKDAEPILLTKDVDYSLVWGKNDQVGKNKGSVTIVGKNTYFSNNFKKTFTINKTDINKVLYDRNQSSALLGSKTADPYLYQTEEFSYEGTPVKAALIQGVDFKVTNIVESAAAKTATATIDASDSKYYSGTLKITYDLYPVEVASVELTTDRSAVLLKSNSTYSTDAFGNRYLDDFAEGNIKIVSAKITYKGSRTPVVLSGDEIDDKLVVGYVGADKTGSNARVVVRFKDGKNYPTSLLFYSKNYTITVKN